jgi:hypothetical protein
MAGAGTFHAACEFRALLVRARTYAEEPDPFQEIYMKRLALIAAVLAVAACAKSENANKDTTTPAMAPAPAPAATTDTTAKMDTTHKMDTTTKKP